MEANKAGKQNIGIADIADLTEIDRADERSTGIIDIAEANKAVANRVEVDKLNKLDTSLVVKDLWRQPAEKQTADQTSLLFFRKVASLFFFSLEFEIFGSSAIS